MISATLCHILLLTKQTKVFLTFLVECQVYFTKIKNNINPLVALRQRSSTGRSLQGSRKISWNLPTCGWMCVSLWSLFLLSVFLCWDTEVSTQVCRLYLTSRLCCPLSSKIKVNLMLLHLCAPLAVTHSAKTNSDMSWNTSRFQTMHSVCHIYFKENWRPIANCIHQFTDQPHASPLTSHTLCLHTVFCSVFYY